MTRLDNIAPVIAGVVTINALCASSAVAGVKSTPPVYTVQFIAPVPAVTAMNTASACIGWTTDQNDSVRAWVWSPGTDLALLPLPPGTDSTLAHAIADNGVIVGSAQFGLLGQPIATAWAPDSNGGYSVQTFEELEGHAGGVATAVNALGDIVGYSISPGWAGGPATLFASSDATQVPLNLQSLGLTATPRDINESRVLTGGSFRMDLDSLIVEDLGVPVVPGFKNNYFAAADLYAINESDQVTGRGLLTTSSYIDQRAIRFTDAIGWEVIDFVPTTENVGVGINEQGDVAIRFSNLAFFDGAGPFDLDDLLDPAEQVNIGWSFGFTYGFPDINNSRQILTVADNVVTQQSGAVLLTPVAPAPVSGDINGDGVVDAADLAMLLAAWGACPDGGDECPADLDGNATIGPADLAILLTNWS